MTLLKTWFGPLQIYKSVPWAKDNKIFTIRKAPSWAGTGKAASDMQELQWAHMVLVAHQGKYMKGKITYVNADGELMSISAPAALVGVLRRRTTEIKGTKEDKELIAIAAEILASHALEKNKTTGELEPRFAKKVEGAEKPVPDIEAAKTFIEENMPYAPVLTKKMRERRFEQRHLSKKKHDKYAERFQELTKLVLKEEQKPDIEYITPAKKDASIFDDFF